MEDLQSLADFRNVPIERVGITKLALPVQIREKNDGFIKLRGIFLRVTQVKSTPTSSVKLNKK